MAFLNDFSWARLLRNAISRPNDRHCLLLSLASVSPTEPQYPLSMALSRVCSLGRGLALRGPTIRAVTSPAVLPSVCITLPRRSFVSIYRHLREDVQSIANSSANSNVPLSQASVLEEQRRKNARSVKLFKVPRRVSRSKVEAFFTDAGFQVSVLTSCDARPMKHLHLKAHVIEADSDSADIYMAIDRFRYEGDTFASVELASEQQAQRAVEELNGNASMGNQVYLRMLSPEFEWDNFLSGDRYEHTYLVREDKSGIRQAVMPLLEGRRVRISVKYPAWGAKGDTPAQRRNTDLEVLKHSFDRFGIESISRLVHQYGDISFDPKFFCHIDFTTKKGADEAIQALHDTEVEGVLVWVRSSGIDATKAFQIGRLEKGLLTELQEKGLAPPDAEIHKDWVSKPTKKDHRNFDRLRNWTDPTNPPKRRSYRSNWGHRSVKEAAV